MRRGTLTAVALALSLAYVLFAGSLSGAQSTITITPATATLAIGQTLDLNASEPNATWTSNNTAIATVTSTGLVTARASGTATITAKYRSDRGTAIVTVASSTGTPASIPGTIQAEDFDAGANGVAYQDSTAGNTGGFYRTTDVDIDTATSDGGGYYVGWTTAGEWLQYSVTVPTAGTFTLDLRVANIGTGAAGHLEIDGADVTGGFAFPNTGAWNVWQTITRPNIPVTAGAHLLRLVFDTANATGGVGNVNWLRFTTAGAPPPTCSYTVTPLSFDFPSGGGIGTVSVTTQAGCDWTASTDQAWAPVTPTSVTGSGTATITTAANATTVTRAASVTVAGASVAVTQDAAPLPDPAPPTNVDFVDPGV